MLSREEQIQISLDLAKPLFFKVKSDSMNFVKRGPKGDYKIVDSLMEHDLPHSSLKIIPGPRHSDHYADVVVNQSGAEVLLVSCHEDKKILQGKVSGFGESPIKTAKFIQSPKGWLFEDESEK